MGVGMVAVMRGNLRGPKRAGVGIGKVLYLHRFQAPPLSLRLTSSPIQKSHSAPQFQGTRVRKRCGTRRRFRATPGHKASAAIGKDSPLGGNHFPLLSRQVSEWRSDLPQAHSWERSDGCVSVSALPTANTWGSISFRAAIHSPPASFIILAAGRQTQRVNWGRGDPRRGGSAPGPRRERGSVTRGRTADRSQDSGPGPSSQPSPAWPRVQPRPLTPAPLPSPVPPHPSPGWECPGAAPRGSGRTR